MKIVKNVEGSKESAKPLIVSKTTVYVHENIRKETRELVSGDIIDVYTYDETQYTKDEYIHLMAARQSVQTEIINLLAQPSAIRQTTENKKTLSKLLEILNNLR